MLLLKLISCVRIIFVSVFSLGTCSLFKALNKSWYQSKPVFFKTLCEIEEKLSRSCMRKSVNNPKEFSIPNRFPISYNISFALSKSYYHKSVKKSDSFSLRISKGFLGSLKFLIF